MTDKGTSDKMPPLHLCNWRWQKKETATHTGHFAWHCVIWAHIGYTTETNLVKVQWKFVRSKSDLTVPPPQSSHLSHVLFLACNQSIFISLRGGPAGVTLGWKMYLLLTVTYGIQNTSLNLYFHFHLTKQTMKQNLRSQVNVIKLVLRLVTCGWWCKHCCHWS